MRVTFATDSSVKYVGHLDMARAWARALRRAGLPLAYKGEFNPQPRIQFAAALPVGVTGLSELVDVYLVSTMEPAEFLDSLQPALPVGIRATGAQLMSMELPSLQSLVYAALYRVEVETGETPQAFQARLDAFLQRPEAWRERRRGKEETRQARYDLRPLVQSLHYTGAESSGQSFETAMRAEPGATGRPDELLAELGFETEPRQMVRLHILLHQTET